MYDPWCLGVAFREHRHRYEFLVRTTSDPDIIQGLELVNEFKNILNDPELNFVSK